MSVYKFVHMYGTQVHPYMCCCPICSSQPAAQPGKADTDAHSLATVAAATAAAATVASVAVCVALINLNLKSEVSPSAKHLRRQPFLPLIT